MDLVCRSHARLCQSLPNETLGKIAVLGAGNGNDLDVPRLCELFEEVHLVDLDQAAVERASETANVDRLHLHAPFDISAPLASGDLAAELMDGSPAPVEACDIVVSSGLLSQLFLTGHQILKNPLPGKTSDTPGKPPASAGYIGEENPSSGDANVFPSEIEMVQWIRGGHWNTIRRMLRPGGSLVMTLDFVSSETAADLLSVSPNQFNAPELQTLAARLLQDGNFFSGLHPGVVVAELQQQSHVALVETTLPWLWDLGPRRYLVMGLVADFHSCGAC